MKIAEEAVRPSQLISAIIAPQNSVQITGGFRDNKQTGLSPVLFVQYSFAFLLQLSFLGSPVGFSQSFLIAVETGIASIQEPHPLLAV